MAGVYNRAKIVAAKIDLYIIVSFQIVNMKARRIHKIKERKFSMRNFRSRLKKLEAKKPPLKRVVRIYWADGTFLGDMVY